MSQAIGRGHPRSGEAGPAVHAGSDPQSAGAARCGVFPSEDSSGKRIRKGGITKAGNAHLRRIVVESAWCYRHWPRVGEKLHQRQQGVPAEIIEIAWKAQNRLHKRYMKLSRQARIRGRS
jgi:transposase